MLLSQILAEQILFWVIWPALDRIWDRMLNAPRNEHSSPFKTCACLVCYPSFSWAQPLWQQREGERNVLKWCELLILFGVTSYVNILWREIKHWGAWPDEDVSVCDASPPPIQLSCIAEHWQWRPRDWRAELSRGSGWAAVTPVITRATRWLVHS